VSVDVAGKDGWAITSCADWLVYVLHPKEALFIRMTSVRSKLPEWMEKNRTGTAKNRGYNTVGVLVPVDELREIADSAVPWSKICKAAL
jgi:hypothetical protein